jgi:predicted regulator of Ras-like GTPase activity (Roadblock/LC7/MglB family)
MGINGNLKDISFADLVQIHCMDPRSARMTVQHQDQQATVFFAEGQVIHAELGKDMGEDVIYQLLSWNEGAFNVDNEVEVPTRTINRMWSGLLLEGARRLDEIETQRKKEAQMNGATEENKMAQKFDEILTSLAGEVPGYIASALVGIDGINIASHTLGGMDPEVVSAQITTLFRLVDASVDKLGAGVLEDNLLSAEKSYILMRFLPGKEYFLAIAANRKDGNLGNLRLMSKMYTEQLFKAMPH